MHFSTTDKSFRANCTENVMQQALGFLAQNAHDQYGSLEAHFTDEYAHKSEHWWLAFKNLLCAFGKACQEDMYSNKPSKARIEQLRQFLNKAMFLRCSIADAKAQGDGSKSALTQATDITMTDISLAHQMISETPLWLGSENHPAQCIDSSVAGDGWYMGPGIVWSREKLERTGWIRR